MDRTNCKIFIAFTLIMIFASHSIFSCKTKKAPLVFQTPLIEKVEEKTVVVQLCDRFQMSYNGLACIVHFSDGSSCTYNTAIDGKIKVKMPLGDVEIEKIVCDFSSYVARSGQLLASRDFKLATRIPSSTEAQTTVVEGTFSSEIKNLFVLVR